MRTQISSLITNTCIAPGLKRLWLIFFSYNTRLPPPATLFYYLHTINTDGTSFFSQSMKFHYLKEPEPFFILLVNSSSWAPSPTYTSETLVLALNMTGLIDWAMKASYIGA